ncbi:hypothetical protein ACFV7Q_02710 [Streptomyces sp. NPDC059851]|uniref:hypothetical protein n=1 Tax=Streptomyces sp. NPDC059851 TaxID=3346971 RepID=UPI0036513561
MSLLLLLAAPGLSVLGWINASDGVINPRAVRFVALLEKVHGDFSEAERLLRAPIELADVEARGEPGRFVDQRDGLEAAEPWFRLAGRAGHRFAERMLRPGRGFNTTAATRCDPGGGRTAPPGASGQKSNRVPLLCRMAHGLAKVYE